MPESTKVANLGYMQDYSSTIKVKQKVTVVKIDEILQMFPGFVLQIRDYEGDPIGGAIVCLQKTEYFDDKGRKVDIVPITEKRQRTIIEDVIIDYHVLLVEENNG